MNKEHNDLNTGLSFDTVPEEDAAKSEFIWERRKAAMEALAANKDFTDVFLGDLVASAKKRALDDFIVRNVDPSQVKVFVKVMNELLDFPSLIPVIEVKKV